MIFASWLFLLVFLPAVLGAFYLASGRLPSVALALLPAATALYCYLTDPRTLVLLSASVVGNYLLLSVIRRSGAATPASRILTACGVVLNLAPLAFYKIGHMTALGIMSQAGPPAIADQPIPLGLAFYSLQQITFLVDAQRAGGPRPGFARYCAWASLFCQLPAGPIAPYGRMAPQLAGLGLRRPPARDIALGLCLFVFGLLKELLLAGRLGTTIDPLYQAAELGPISRYEAAAAIWGFMMQLYFNFSAYSDMAIGLALCVGLRLPPNFDSPLKARSLGGYIMRWHMSLMQFIRDYVFVPTVRLLSRQRRGWSPVGAWAAATVASYVAMAAWHSPSAMFVGFSVFGSLVVIATQVVRSAAATRRSTSSTRWAGSATAVLGHLSTLAIVATVAMLLRAESLEGARNLMTSLGDLGDTPGAAVPLPKLLVMIAAASVVALACPNTMRLFGILEAAPAASGAWWRWRPTPAWGWVFGASCVLALLLLTRATNHSGFIYARF